MLAKMFLTKAGVGMPGDGSRRQIDLDSAAYYSRSVIANGPYKLMENYEDLYLLKNNNNVESIFALQWVFNREWGTANALQSFLAFSSGITGVGDGWGSQWGAGLNTLQLYEDLAKDKRRKATYMFPGDKYDYITYELNGVKKPLVVPFTADGNYTRGYSDYAWIKKYVIGRPEDNNGQVLFMNTGNNTYMMRFAEVYLTLAEAILGNAASTSDAEAVGAVNKIRVRAGLQPVTQITWYDIYRERMLEFAMENMSTFDYARLHSYNPQKAYKMLSEMNRGYYRIRVQPNINNPVSWTVEERAGNETDRYTNVNATNFYLPIPQAEQIRAPNLLKPPVPYISGSN